VSSALIFQTSVALGLIVWAVIARSYVWPALQAMPRAEAFKPILLLHSFRFVGLAFLLPGVVSADLPAAFAVPAAYGDIATALLALLALLVGPRGLGLILVWIFNLVGSADLLFAFYRGFTSRLIANDLGAAYFIPTVLVPLLLVTHGLVFILLLREDAGVEAHSRAPAASPDDADLSTP